MRSKSFDSDIRSDGNVYDALMGENGIPRYLPKESLTEICSVVSIGRAAWNILKISNQGKVSASFRRSLYLEFDGGWCCLATGGLSAGPLNIVTTSAGRLDKIRLNTGVFFSGGKLFVGNQLQLAPRRWPVWHPPVVIWSRQTLSYGLANFDSLCLGRNPHRGLSRLVWSGPLGDLASPELARAQPVFDSLSLWLRRALSNRSLGLPPKEIVNLLGLGPGLTPSGDDFLVGLLIALALCGRKDLVSVVDQMIRPSLTRLTGPISRLHILSAVDGEGNESLHRAINAILIGDHNAMASQLNSISLIGHTSGWDALAGAVTVFQELIRAQT